MPVGFHNEVFWVVTACGLVGGVYTVSNFRVEVRHHIVLQNINGVTSCKII